MMVDNCTFQFLKANVKKPGDVIVALFSADNVYNVRVVKSDFLAQLEAMGRDDELTGFSCQRLDNGELWVDTAHT